jgi:hypothetical protein
MAACGNTQLPEAAIQTVRAAQADMWDVRLAHVTGTGKTQPASQADVPGGS